MLLVATDLRKSFPAVEFGAGAAAGAERARSVAADGDVAKPVVKDGAEGPVAWVTCGFLRTPMGGSCDGSPERTRPGRGSSGSSRALRAHSAGASRLR